MHIRGEHLAVSGRPTVRLRKSAGASGHCRRFLHHRPRAGIGDGRRSCDLHRLTAKASIYETHLGVQIADSLHPVANPAVDAEGNIYSTFSGSRGQKSPVSIYKIDTNYNSKPFVTDLMNPTGLAFDREGLLYVSSRYDGIVYQITPTGNMSVYVEGMGVATGIAFDRDENLYVGDRSGTIFKISRSRQIYVFATLEPSIAAYHLAFGPEDYLYVTGRPRPASIPFIASRRRAKWKSFYRGLGRPQGLAFDAEGRSVCGCFAGRPPRHHSLRSDRRKPEQFLSGPGIVGLAFTPSRVDDRCDPQRAVSRGCRHRRTAACRNLASWPRHAEIIAIGSELLTPQRIDTNSLSSPSS